MGKYPEPVATGRFYETGVSLESLTPEELREWAIKANIRAAYAMGGVPREDSPYKDVEIAD